MPKPRPRRESTPPNLEPYKCFVITCTNMITPTVRSRPWFCPHCHALQKAAARKQEKQLLEQRKRPWRWSRPHGNVKKGSL